MQALLKWHYWIVTRTYEEANVSMDVLEYTSVTVKLLHSHQAALYKKLNGLKILFVWYSLDSLATLFEC